MTVKPRLCRTWSEIHIVGVLTHRLIVFTEHRSAFSTTASQLAEGSNYGIVLGSVRSNIGGHYNESTGQFVCKYPGVYVFSLNLYREDDGLSSHCDIRRNGEAMAFAYAPYTEGYHEGSATIVLHLNYEDIVDVGRCRSVDYIAGWTNFHGFLLYPD